MAYQKWIAGCDCCTGGGEHCPCPDWVDIAWYGGDLNKDGDGCNGCADVTCDTDTQVIYQIQIVNSNCSLLPPDPTIYYTSLAVKGAGCSWTATDFDTITAAVSIDCENGWWVFHISVSGTEIGYGRLSGDLTAGLHIFTGQYGSFQVNLIEPGSAPGLSELGGCLWSGPRVFPVNTGDTYGPDYIKDNFPAVWFEGARCSYVRFNPPYGGATDIAFEQADAAPPDDCMGAAMVLLQYFNNGSVVDGFPADDGSVVYILSIAWTNTEYVRITCHHKISPPRGSTTNYVRPLEICDEGSIGVEVVGSPPCDFQWLVDYPQSLAFNPAPFTSDLCAIPYCPDVASIITEHPEWSTVDFTITFNNIALNFSGTTDAWDDGAWEKTYTVAGVELFNGVTVDVQVTVSISCKVSSDVGEFDGHGYWVVYVLIESLDFISITANEAYLALVKIQDSLPVQSDDSTDPGNSTKPLGTFPLYLWAPFLNLGYGALLGFFDPSVPAPFTQAIDITFS